MKKGMLVIMCVAIFVAHQTNAQDTTTTLLKLPKINHLGFYIAPEFQYGQLKNGFTGFGGNSFMLLINKKLGIGMTMQNSLDRSYSPSSVAPLHLNARLNGLKLEYVLNGSKAIHFTFPLVIGMASARADSAIYTKMNHSFNDTIPHSRGGFNGRRNDNNSHYFIAQPGVQVEANMFKFMKLYAGVNYRFAWKDSWANALPVSTVQGVSANVGVKLGLFEVATHRKKK